MWRACFVGERRNEAGAIERPQVQFKLVAPVVKCPGLTSDLATRSEKGRLARSLGGDANRVGFHNYELVDLVPQFAGQLE